MAQLVTRLPDELARQVDDLVVQGVVQSRSEAVREGLLMLVDRHRRARVAEAIVDGYLRSPQTDDEAAWSDEATKRMIAEETW